jgi:hypothetical protein
MDAVPDKPVKWHKSTSTLFQLSFGMEGWAIKILFSIAKSPGSLCDQCRNEPKKSTHVPDLGWKKGTRKNAIFPKTLTATKMLLSYPQPLHNLNIMFIFQQITKKF